VHLVKSLVDVVVVVVVVSIIIVVLECKWFCFTQGQRQQHTYIMHHQNSTPHKTTETIKDTLATWQAIEAYRVARC
jgi:hypothetical protein